MKILADLTFSAPRAQFTFLTFEVIFVFHKLDALHLVVPTIMACALVVSILSQRFIGSLLFFLVPLNVFVLSQLPHTVLELESLKTLFFKVVWYPLSVFLVPYWFLLEPLSVFVLSQLSHAILFLKNLKTFVLCVSFHWFQELILLISGAKAREVIKSRLLGLILSASGAKARKSLNGDFWD